MYTSSLLPFNNNNDNDDNDDNDNDDDNDDDNDRVCYILNDYDMVSLLASVCCF